MNTPIADFVEAYVNSGIRRFHMPGHKGNGLMGFEKYDITEIKGADALYEADGIIAESENNAASLFGSGRTLYSTEGSSQCIRAMLHLAVTQRHEGAAPVIIAARNVHKAFVYSAALTGFDVDWLFPDEAGTSICACPVSPESLDKKLSEAGCIPAAVYVTSPDYLGGMQDIAALAEVCHRHGTILLADNAHGAYLKFCEPSMHPIDLGADICCDSAHKTLPVLTGGAYLHISKNLPSRYIENAKQSMVLFGSTSPSYLTLCSLDRCNAYLAGEYRTNLAHTVTRIDRLCNALVSAGWKFDRGEPLKLTIHASSCGLTGQQLAERFREHLCECEYADADDMVLMFTPENSPEDFDAILPALGNPGKSVAPRMPLPRASGKSVMSVREAFFAPHETIASAVSLGRICAAPTVACPPAIPIAVSGEIITEEAVKLFGYYGIESVDVVKV